MQGGPLEHQTEGPATNLAFHFECLDVHLTFFALVNDMEVGGMIEYRRVTNKLDQARSTIFRYQCDASERLTNRWTPAKLGTTYGYDAQANLISVTVQRQSADHDASRQAKSPRAND